jgi:hypothetical protein
MHAPIERGFLQELEKTQGIGAPPGQKGIKDPNLNLRMALKVARIRSRFKP